VEREAAVFFEVSAAVAVKRLLSRLTCQQCGAIYNLNNKLPKKNGICDLCQGKVARRADDNRQSVKQRIKVYFEQTMPVIEYYERKKTLNRVEASGAADLVYEKVKRLVA
jgi:adenylate kinase